MTQAPPLTPKTTLVQCAIEVFSNNTPHFHSSVPLKHKKNNGEMSVYGSEILLKAT